MSAGPAVELTELLARVAVEARHATSSPSTTPSHHIINNQNGDSLTLAGSANCSSAEPKPSLGPSLHDFAAWVNTQTPASRCSTAHTPIRGGGGGEHQNMMTPSSSSLLPPPQGQPQTVSRGVHNHSPDSVLQTGSGGVVAATTKSSSADLQFGGVGFGMSGSGNGAFSFNSKLPVLSTPPRCANKEQQQQHQPTTLFNNHNQQQPSASKQNNKMLPSLAMERGDFDSPAHRPHYHPASSSLLLRHPAESPSTHGQEHHHPPRTVTPSSAAGTNPSAAPFTPARHVDLHQHPSSSSTTPSTAVAQQHVHRPAALGQTPPSFVIGPGQVLFGAGGGGNSSPPSSRRTPLFVPSPQSRPLSVTAMSNHGRQDEETLIPLVLVGGSTLVFPPPPPPLNGQHRGATMPPPPPSATVTPPQMFPLYPGQALEAAKDQAGCRALQRVFETFPYDSAEIQSLLAELSPHFSELMMDAYGNFLIQKVLEWAPDTIRLHVTSMVAPSLARIATTPHGTFAVQKLVESLRSDEESVIVCEGLSRDVPLLMNDINGGHVVAKILSALPSYHREFLFHGIAKNVVEVCNHKQGCCTVQKCLDVATVEQLMVVQEAVALHFVVITGDPYGNYVASKLLDRGSQLLTPISGNGSSSTTNITPPPLNAAAAELIALRVHQLTAFTHILASDTGAVVRLCRDKYGSNVIEKLLKHSNVCYICGWSSQPFETLLTMICLTPLEILFEGCGNYVVQSALALCPPTLAPTSPTTSTSEGNNNNNNNSDSGSCNGSGVDLKNSAKQQQHVAIQQHHSFNILPVASVTLSEEGGSESDLFAAKKRSNTCSSGGAVTGSGSALLTTSFVSSSIITGEDSSSMPTMMPNSSMMMPPPPPYLVTLVETLLPALSLISQNNFGKKVETALADALRRLFQTGYSLPPALLPLPPVLLNLLHAAPPSQPPLMMSSSSSPGGAISPSASSASHHQISRNERHHGQPASFVISPSHSSNKMLGMFSIDTAAAPPPPPPALQWSATGSSTTPSRQSHPPRGGGGGSDRRW